MKAGKQNHVTSGSEGRPNKEDEEMDEMMQLKKELEALKKENVALKAENERLHKENFWLTTKGDE